MSRRSRWLIALIGTIVGFESGTSSAQVGSSVPVIAGVFPPGATVGQTTEWAISGRNLSKVSNLRISGGGVEILELLIKDETTATAKVRVASDASPGFREVRLDGASGVSNLAIVRIDRLEQVLEVEPNDDPELAQEVEVGSALIGVLQALDVDDFRIKGKPGQRLTLDLEARRVGTSISPVVTVFSASGAAIAQGREMRGGDGDCRMTVVLPDDGVCVVQVRDNVYGGNNLAKYRLRVEPTPFATGVFPLGGPKGQTIEVELCGGNLLQPRRKSITLPDVPGTFVLPGEFEGPDGPVASPARLIVGEDSEIFELTRPANGSPIELTSGVTINGRLSEAGEVDVYRLRVKTGDKIRARVEADSLGSWLDSVLAIRDDKGAILAQNDDSSTSAPAERPRAVSAQGIPGPSPDSTVDYEVKADGILTIELADRFGDGGPEYGYRLSIGPTRPDFSVTLLLGNANANARAMGNLNTVRAARTTPGQFGVFNLKPAGSVALNFLVTPEGRPGPIEVRAEGLPEGVTAEPVTVRLGGPPTPGTSSAAPEGTAPASDFLLLKVAPFAQPGLSEFRVVASTKSAGLSITREASATIGIDSVAVSNRPITRVLMRFPLKVLGEARPLFVGPPAPPTLRKVGVPGPLLQGDRIDLALDFSNAVTADDGSSIEARAEGVGLSTNTVISAGTSLTEEAGSSDVTIHVLASIKAQLGPHFVKVSYTPAGGSTVEREVMVEVKAPIEVRPLAESIFLRAGDNATLGVEVRREPGFDGEVEMKLEGLPRGVKAGKPITLTAGMAKAEFRLEMSAEAKPLANPVEVRVVGMARMPRGNVAVDSKIRPMIRPRPADK
jgi:hypothetical protein